MSSGNGMPLEEKVELLLFLVRKKAVGYVACLIYSIGWPVYGEL